MPDPFLIWYEALEKRHLANLTFSEVRRAVQALSSIYVESRRRIDSGAPLDGAGKRAAFAMFYAPLHLLLIRQIIKALDAASLPPSAILDLGCGTGAAGAGWALECGAPQPNLIGVDRNTWALHECKWTYQQLGLRGTCRSADIRTLRIPAETGVIAAFTINELDDGARSDVLDYFLKVAGRGAPILIVEPIARRSAPWWDEWSEAFRGIGGRDDRWRFRIELPEKLRLMDRAAGLDHRELTARTLWIPASMKRKPMVV
jgi:hypothetical protein